jgi:NADH-ubiquinone oxidoreductase chain 4L
MLFTLLLFTIGILGYIINRKNIILLFISIEIMLLSITLLILIGSNLYNDLNGLLYGIIVLIIAGIESAIGLSILINYYKLKGSLLMDI